MAVFTSYKIEGLIGRITFKVSKKLQPIVDDFYKDAFAKEGSYFAGGFVKWKDLAESTLAIRQKNGYPYPEYPMLVNTGKLLEGFRIIPTTKGLNIVNNVSYAAEQNKVRPFIYPSPQLMTLLTQEIQNGAVEEILNNIRESKRNKSILGSIKIKI